MEQFIGDPEMTDVHHRHDLSGRMWSPLEPHLLGCRGRCGRGQPTLPRCGAVDPVHESALVVSAAQSDCCSRHHGGLQRGWHPDRGCGCRTEPVIPTGSSHTATGGVLPRGMLSMPNHSLPPFTSDVLSSGVITRDNTA